MCSTNEAVPKKVEASDAYQKQQHRKNETLLFQASYFSNSSAICTAFSAAPFSN